jgi:hypothetical protein
MCDLGAVGSAAGPVDWAIYGIALSAAAIVFALVLGMRWVAGRFAPPDVRLIWAMLAVIVLCGIVFRARFGKAVDWILDNTVVRILERKRREH